MGVGLAILIGIVGVVVPVLPGSALIVLAVLIWGVAAQSTVGWWVASICAAIALAGWALQYVIPTRHLRLSGVPNRTLVVGAIVGVVGFFVIPGGRAAARFHRRDRLG